MKKVFMIIICALTVLLTISVVGFVLIKVGIIDLIRLNHRLYMCMKMNLVGYIQNEIGIGSL